MPLSGLKVGPKDIIKLKIRVPNSNRWSYKPTGIQNNKTIKRDAPLDIWGGGGVQFIVDCNLFHLCKKTIYFGGELQANFEKRKYQILPFAFPILYIAIYWNL